MSEANAQPSKGRFEIERDGLVSFLAYETDGHDGITLLHTEVPPAIRHLGIGTELAHMAMEHAKENHLKVEVICPMVFHFLNQHPEYKSLVRLPKPYPSTP